MKKCVFFISMIICFISYGQIPSYYGDVNLTLSGQALKNELSSKVINTHTTFLSYTPGVWDALKQTDLDPTDSSKVLLAYGWNDNDSDTSNDRTRGVNDNGGNSGDWNREHVYPRSLGNPNLGSTGPGSDGHHLRSCDPQRNSSRSNRKFADGNGNSGITSQGYWYPGDEWKGDVARMMMYMYIRYENRTLPSNVGIGNPVSGDTDMIDLFLEWNAEDPVSDLEKQRNPVLENLQGNRNPFIDNPAFATQIWGGSQAEDLFGNTGGSDTVAPSIPAGLLAANTTTTTTQLTWSASSDNVAVTGYDVYRNGTFLTAVSSTGYNASNLTANTTYAFAVRAKDAAGNVSGLSNAINVTTQDAGSGGNATELFFSEYIEGSSFNKAFEIANFTGGAINLSIYEVRKQTNGSGSWSGGLNLTGTLANGEMYVAANSSAATAIQNEANITTGSSELTFNGNDALGLFKNGVLIDIIGTFNGGSANFAKDVTLVRKPSISMPSTTYNISEWNSFSQNTFGDLGTHTFDGGGPTPDTQAPSTPANLAVSNITQNSVDLAWSASTDNVGVTFYQVLTNSSVLGTTSGLSYTASGLSASTSYTFEVVAYDAANNSSNGATVNASTLDNTITYCNARGNNASYEFIDYVEVGGISNATGANGGYGDFTSQVGNLSYGSNTIILSVGFASSSYTENWGVWIDYNQNGTFESSEQIVIGSTSNAGNLSYSFSVPSSAFAGNTRMRVSMKWNGAPTACETFSYGEVEDYTVNIGTRAKTMLTSTKIDGELGFEKPVFVAEVYPNPATSYVTIKMKDDRQVNYSFTDMLGRIVKTGNITNQTIDLQGLQKGVYIIKVKDVGNREFFKKIMLK